MSDGLPSNEVYQVEEDPSGQLLIATDRGMVRYDGYGFHPLQPERKLGVSPVFGIYNAPSGNIYCYSAGDIYMYRQDSLHPYRYNHLIVPRLPDGSPAVHEPVSIYSLAEKGDSLWVVFPGPGRELIMPGGHTYYPHDEAGIYFDLKNRSFYQVQGQAGRNIRIHIRWEDGTGNTDSLPYPYTDVIKRLLHTQVNGMDVFCIYDHLFIYRNKKKIGSYRLERPVLSLLPYGKDKLLVGYQNGGAGLYRLTGRGLTDPVFYALPGISVYDIFHDFQGGIWFSTLDKGLFYAHPNQVSSWHYPDEITAVGQKGQKSVISYRSGTIRIFEQGVLKHTIQVALKQGEILLNCYYTGRDNYFAITNLGVYHQRHDIRRFWPLAPSSSNPLPSSPAKLVFPVNDSIFYMGYSGIFYRFHTTGGYTGEKTVVYSRMSSMVKEDSGRYWFGTFNGLYKKENGVLHALVDRDSLLQTRVIALGLLPDSFLAIATLGSGLLLYHSTGHKINVLHEDNGLPSVILHNMQIVKDTIWLSSNKGIVAVTFRNDRFDVYVYDQSCGLPTVDIKEFCVAGGWLYFKYNDRLYAASISRLREIKPMTQTMLTAVEVNGREMPLLQPGSLDHKASDIKLHFRSINFERGAYQTYRYRLKGNGSNKWYTTSDRQALFTNLQPGAYVFEVQAADASGRYDQSAAAYAFTIHPPFWNTVWFYVLTGGMILLVALLLIRRRVEAIKQRNQLFLSLAEHQQKALVQQMSPHFIYNIVNAAQSAIIHEQKMQAIEILSRFTRLMRLSLDLSREKTVLLGREVQLLEKYLELETIRFPGKFTYMVHTDAVIDSQTVRIPSMLVQPFVENAIKHGISHLPGKEGRIEITFGLNGDLLLCTVSDNGIGRERSARINSNRMAYHRSAGMAITAHRLELLHKEQGQERIYRVEDKYYEDGTAAGTTIIFSIPYNS